MANAAEAERRRAVERVLDGETVSAVCNSLGYTRAWLYKWLGRHHSGDPDWYSDRSRRPRRRPKQTSAEIEKIVQSVRKRLEKSGEFSGAQAIRWEMEDLEVQPLPSIRTISRILTRHDLTAHRVLVVDLRQRRRLVGHDRVQRVLVVAVRHERRHPRADGS